MVKPSPLAPDRFPDLPRIAGLRLGAASCGIRYRGRKDLFLAELDPGATLGGVFTRSLTASAAVAWCRASLSGGSVRAIVANSGNSNAFTGKAGIDAVESTVKTTAEIVGCKPRDVFVASTGVIGEALPVDRIVAKLPGLKGRLSGARTAWRDAAVSILTTDTFPKGATRSARIDGASVLLNGIAKGSGMIAPDMATMLAFLFTDAAIPASVLQKLLDRANARTFNAITVDGDTSTSDTVLLCATGKGPTHEKVSAACDRRLRDFREKLEDLMRDLAQQVVRDGEGAGKFIAISVTGAASEKAARRIGLSIANSPLVKTAIAGGDANWGRIVMAVGKAGEKADRDSLRIAIGGVTVAENGAAVPGYDETPVAAHMKGREIVLEVDVGVGRARATVWTCDLTHGYVSINADYRS